MWGGGGGDGQGGGGQGHSQTRSSTSQLPGLLSSSWELRGHVTPIPGGQDRIPLPPSPASPGRSSLPTSCRPAPQHFSKCLAELPRSLTEAGVGGGPPQGTCWIWGDRSPTHTANLLPAPRKRELPRLALELEMLGGSWHFFRLRPWASAPHGSLVCG